MDDRRDHAGVLLIGADIGSTTVKTVVLDAADRRMLHSDYRYHKGRQAAELLRQLAAIEAGFAGRGEESRLVLTGSGAQALAAALNVTAIHEVNATVLAVECFHPAAGSVVELGGQDAKIVFFGVEPTTGQRRVSASMNDKCASGTGATLDKCLMKLAMTQDEAAAVAWNPHRLHRVAAKCGVFAETDIVNLLKAGVPRDEILCSLADAIVLQNLSVLTRGQLLRPKVLLLGGPIVHLPVLQASWRQRIGELWRQRGGEGVPSDVLVPEGGGLFAATGAALSGTAAGTAAYRGSDGLAGLVHRQGSGLARRTGLVRDAEELDDFVRRYRPAEYQSPKFSPGQTVRVFIGIDGGSTSSKMALIDERNHLVAKYYRLSRGNPLDDVIQLFRQARDEASHQGAQLVVEGVGVTGSAADLVEQAIGADVKVVETIAHMEGAKSFCGDVDVICDVGGQDIKVLIQEGGELRDFRLSSQCSAGNGMMLHAMAEQFGIAAQDYAATAFAAQQAPVFTCGCAVFLDAERVTLQKEGFTKEEMLAGLAQVLPHNIWQYVAQISQLGRLGRRFLLQGGTQYNLAAVKAQVDYIHARVPDAEILVHPHPGEAGAIGAAVQVREHLARSGRSVFIGIDAAVALSFSARTDDETVCRQCSNHCRRTFIEVGRPGGGPVRFVAGAGCELGASDDEDLRKVRAKRRQQAQAAPNLLDWAAKSAFRAGPPLPAAATSPRKIRIGMPRVLGMYAAAPFWSGYFRALGVQPSDIVYSSVTNQDLWQAGAHYGSTDPCFPAKVAQAHLHQLLFSRKIDIVFFPCLTHVPTQLTGMTETLSCPLLAGAPAAMRAAFTMERNHFACVGVTYVDAALCFGDHALFRRQLFEALGPVLGIPSGENDAACRQGFATLAEQQAELQRRGRAVIEKAETTGGMAVVLLGRPYHADPGLSHGIGGMLQDLGYPVVPVSAIPRDPAWIAERLRRAGAKAAAATPLSVNHLWPGSFSVNSAEKLWAAQLAAYHPSLAIADLSSFKCGLDAPLYGLIRDLVVSTGTPYLALHDLDTNCPTGSIRIRLRTFDHALKRYSRAASLLSAESGV